MTRNRQSACREIRQSIYGEDDGTKEAEQYLKALLQVSKHNLPLNLPGDVWGVMAPAVLYPGQMEEFYETLAKVAPCTWHMMVRPPQALLLYLMHDGDACMGACGLAARDSAPTLCCWEVPCA